MSVTAKVILYLESAIIEQVVFISPGVNTTKLDLNCSNYVDSFVIIRQSKYFARHTKMKRRVYGKLIICNITVNFTT